MRIRSPTSVSFPSVLTMPNIDDNNLPQSITIATGQPNDPRGSRTASPTSSIMIL